MPSIFQPINVYNTHDESEHDVEQENNDVSSAGQTQLNHLALNSTPEQVMTATVPTFNDPESVIKETINVNADLPIETQDQSFGERGFRTKSITPVSEKNDSPSRPFAKTQRLIEMESNRSSVRNTQRQRQTPTSKINFASV